MTSVVYTFNYMTSVINTFNDMRSTQINGMQASDIIRLD